MMQREEFRNAKILIVDDQEANVRLLENILKRAGYTQLMTSTDSREVLTLSSTFKPDLLLLDLMMPHMDGFEVMQSLRTLVPKGTYQPVLVLTADTSPETKERALSMGATDFVAKPFDRVEFLLRIENLLETRFLYLQLQDQNQELEERVLQRTRELEEAHMEILERLGLAAEYRDDDTGQHTQRVSRMCARLARALALSDFHVELIKRTAPLHDVGKIGIPDQILLKPGKLTKIEFDIMKTHTTIGARILSGGQSRLIKTAQLIVLTHHERWDGTGYPRGLKADVIPIEGRIVAIADVFDALTNERPYKKAWPVEEAIAEIRAQSGKHFDPRLVEAFLAQLKTE